MVGKDVQDNITLCWMLEEDVVDELPFRAGRVRIGRIDEVKIRATLTRCAGAALERGH